MDVGEAFRQGLGSVNRAREARSTRRRESSHDDEDHGPRIAHTLAACCRCRQRKTRCDPALPRCVPCERAGAVCEYWDTTKGKKISRSYVVKLQEKVRELENELDQYTEKDLAPPDTEDCIRPGGLVHLEEHDDMPRFLGPSSGIAMTRLVMEEAKRYTDSRTIRELVPEVVTRRTPVSSPEADAAASTERKKSYPMISAVPADELPSRLVTDKLVEVFNQKAQYLFPTIHEATFEQEVNDVYNGDLDPYKNFVLRIVLAISMQKLDTQYAGLADSYYLAAMGYIEAVIRPKDLKTLQCLVLIAQYSLLTPTRTAIYYIIGLATRLCQQLALNEETTITRGEHDVLQMDMRRRMAWCVLNMEFGLSHSLGRPNGFAIREDHFDVKFFAKVDDQYITKDGLLPAPISEKKVMCEHFFYMRLLQAEIRRVLYQMKRPEPRNEEHPWFLQMETKLRDWLENSPASPPWSKPWFTSKYNTMIVFLFRPSPQVPKPSVRAAKLCYDASAYNIKSQNLQMDNSSFDMTWVWLQSLFMAVNTILWTISYQDVRVLHSKEELEEHIRIALSIITRCTERWPGSASAAELYGKLSKACLRAYTAPSDRVVALSSPSPNSPSSVIDGASPNSDHSTATSTSQSFTSKPEPPPAFGTVFDQAPDDSVAKEYYKSIGAQAQPSFRSSSIFVSPATMQTDRRFSYFPPEFTQQMPNGWENVPLLPQQSSAFQDQQPAPTHQRQRSGLQTSQQMPQEQQQQQQQQQQLQQQQQQQQQQQPQKLQYSHQPTPPLLAPNHLTDSTYFMGPAPTFNFGPHLYAADSYNAPGREGSLSLQQQQELMNRLETVGMDGIDSYLALVPQIPHLHGAEG